MRATARPRSVGRAAAAAAVALLVAGCGQDTAPATGDSAPVPSGSAPAAVAPTEPAAEMEKLLNDAESAAHAAETDIAADD
ncbi:hypothetical protein [Streptomyces sp. NPDC002187]|uniref:hypothetical protein n=1 Tax=Streptomyces sp. NPDC002187 TaxID=3364637 RepID=UPI003697B394